MPNNNLSTDHFESFGRIMVAYASIETGFKYAICGMLDIFPYEAMAISEPYNSLSLRNVLKALAKQNLETKEADRLVHLVGEFGTYAKLRNHIAHNDWTSGSRSVSIRPVQMNIREGRIDPRGFSPDERDYTLSELIESANKLFDLRRRVVEFLFDSGIAEAIEQKMDENNSPNATED